MRCEESLLTGTRTAAGSALTGTLDGVDEQGRVWFRADGTTEAQPVELALAVSDEEIVRAADEGAGAVVLRPENEPGRLLLIGLLRRGVAASAGEVVVEPDEAPATRPDIAVIDGKTVRFEARDEIVLECGKGSITLRKDGRIVIKGTHLLSRATGMHRIKGGQVNIN